MTVHALLAAWIAPVDAGLTGWTRSIHGHSEGEKRNGET
jgi:hypothetical protein